jgi:hypothetical protein
MQDALGAGARLASFFGDRLTRRIGALETALRQVSGREMVDSLKQLGWSSGLVGDALTVKNASAQIDVIVHTLGIMSALPLLLAPDERVEYVSLGAGNTGRSFDLETSSRVAEFKFITWRGGSETIRQNALFKDFFLLAEHPTPKEKFLYVLDTTHPLRFLRSRRSIASILSRHVELSAKFAATYGGQYRTVGDYYRDREQHVQIVDLAPLLLTQAGD